MPVPGNKKRHFLPSGNAFGVCILLYADIPVIAKSKDWQENERQKQESEPESRAPAKHLCQLEVQHDHHHKVHAGDEHQKKQPPAAECDVELAVITVERDKDGPSGLACLYKYFPHGGDQDDTCHQCK